MERELFSYYNPPVSKAVLPSGDPVSLEDIFQIITTDRTLEEKTETLRDTLLNDGEERYREDKRRVLPSTTFGGVFDYRHSDPQKYKESLKKRLQTEKDPKTVSKIERTLPLLEGKKGLLSASSLLVIDIDHLSQTGLSPQDVRERLSQDREIGVRLVFLSPSGDGVKLVCKSASRIESVSQYEEVHNRLRHYIDSTYPGVITDPSGKDITRLCFLPFDSQAILLDWEDTFHPEKHPLPSTQRESTGEDYKDLLRDFNRLPDPGDGVEEIVERVEESGRDIAPEYPQYLPLVYSFTALGERGRSLLHRVCRFSPKYNREETDKDWENCLRRGETQSIGYFINLCKESGIDVTFPSRSPRKPVSRDSRERPGQTAPKTQTETPSGSQKETPEERVERYKRDYLTIPDLQTIASTKREGLPTPYYFKDSEGREERLLLTSGGLTIIGGQSSHGKSRFLQNLALQIATEEYNKGGEGVVLYFAFEETRLEIVERFANIQVNIPHISGYPTTKNTEVFRDYFKTGSLNKCPQGKRVEVLQKLSGFTTLYTQGRLRIYYTPELFSGDLCLLLEYLSSQMKIKAVFLDYIQAIYKEGNRKDRREELREISKDLNKVAKDLDLPLILSAQLNRETPSPTDMSGSNIAESQDIPRYADTVLLMWDSVRDRDLKDKKSYLESRDYSRLQSIGFSFESPGKLYTILDKNRGGTPYLESVLEYVPDTGVILPNEDLPLENSSLNGTLEYD